MTLKNYLEDQLRHWSKVKQEAVIDSTTYNKADGRVMAYLDVILAAPDEALNKKIGEVL
jgi:hypothetical protein